MVEVTKPDAPMILKKYLASKGITQVYVAKKMGIKYTSFNAHLIGQAKFNGDFAISVSKALGISPDIFLKKKYRNSVLKRKEAVMK